MKKRTVLIIFIVLTIVSIAWMIIDYLGLLRLYMLKRKSSLENLIKQYSSIERAGKPDEKIVISFSVSEKNKERLINFINSILDQTVRVDDIIAVNNTKGDLSEIKDVAKIIPCGIDYGNLNKVIYPLIREKNNDAIIISLDENTIYDKDYIEKMYELQKSRPQTLLYNEKVLICSPNMFKTCLFNQDEQYDMNKIKSLCSNYEKI